MTTTDAIKQSDIINLTEVARLSGMDYNECKKVLFAASIRPFLVLPRGPSKNSYFYRPQDVEAFVAARQAERLRLKAEKAAAKASIPALPPQATNPAPDADALRVEALSVAIEAMEMRMREMQSTLQQVLDAFTAPPAPAAQVEQPAQAAGAEPKQLSIA